MSVKKYTAIVFINSGEGVKQAKYRNVTNPKKMLQTLQQMYGGVQYANLYDQKLYDKRKPAGHNFVERVYL